LAEGKGAASLSREKGRQEALKEEGKEEIPDSETRERRSLHEDLLNQMGRCRARSLQYAPEGL